MKKLWTSPFVLFLREAIMLYFSRRVPQAAACLAYGSDAVILKHPESIKTISQLVAALM